MSTHDGLVIRGVSKSFGGVSVLSDVELDVRPGEVVALLGENGAGKSTLSSIIAGSQPADSGTLSWNGRPYSPSSPGEAIAAGIGMIHQELRLLPDLTIAENVFVGRLPTKHGIVDRARMENDAARQLSRLGLNLPPDRLVRTLRIAQQQQVEIAKALLLNARLLILDEPTAALGGHETELLFAQIARLKADGVSFIYISHRLDEIAKIADRITVLRDGRKVADFEKGTVPVRTLVEHMVGRTVDRMFPKLETPDEEIVLEVESLSAPDGTFRNVSFAVRRGEILGIAGLIGAGRTELVRAVTGADPAASGRIRVLGATITLSGPHDAIRAGMALVPEDRKHHGVVVDHSIEENLALANYDRLSVSGWIWPKAVRRFAEAGIEKMGVKGRAEQLVRRLSGGNQQKVVIAKWLARAPRIVVLDEPTRGIDVGARAAIYEVIVELAKQGMAVIVVSSDLEEVLGLSHRVLVLSRGRQTGLIDRADATNIKVMELATA